MTTQLDLQLLSAEERTLFKISEKLKEQLNRLQVEELALLSRIRKSSDNLGQTSTTMNESASPKSDEPSDQPSTSYDTPKSEHLHLDLRPTFNAGNTAEVEEEEEEENDTFMEHDQLSSFVKHMT